MVTNTAAAAVTAVPAAAAAPQRAAAVVPAAAAVPAAATPAPPPSAAAAAAPQLSYLSDEELQRYKNNVIAHVITVKVFDVVFRWGAHKPPHQTYLDYLVKEKNLTEKKLLASYGFYPCEIERLRTDTESSLFDVAMMFNLVRAGCDALERPSSVVWKKHASDHDHDHNGNGKQQQVVDLDKLEVLLAVAKDLRNHESHKMEKKTCPMFFDKVRQSLAKVIEVSGKFYSKSESEIEAELRNLQDQIDEIASTKNKQLIHLQKWFCKEAFEESWDYLKRSYTTDIIPFSGDKVNREKVFHPLDVIATDDEKKDSASGKKGNPVPFTSILDDDRLSINSRKPVVILTGEPGSGKSTVIKFIFMMFFGLSGASTSMESLKEFDLIHFMECRDRVSGSLVDFIRNSFPKTSSRPCYKDVLNCFLYLKNLVIIDGYDELIESSAVLVREVLQILKKIPLGQAVFTTRTHAAENLQRMLALEGIEYRTFRLVDIVEEDKQVEFLERFEKSGIVETVSDDAAADAVDDDAAADAAPTAAADAVAAGPAAGGDGNTDNPNPSSSSSLSATFRGLNEQVKSFFIYPINLVLFYHLHRTSDGRTIANWRTVNDVAHHILYQYEIVIRNKVNSLGDPRVDSVIRRLLREVNNFAFECLATNRICLDEEDFNSIHDRCSALIHPNPDDAAAAAGGGGGGGGVTAMSVLSVVLQTKVSPAPVRTTVRQFYHKILLEKMAASSLVAHLKHDKHRTLEDVFKVKLASVHVMHASPHAGGAGGEALLQQDDEGPNQLYVKYLNVLKYALIELSGARERPLLQHRLVQLRQLLEEGGAGFEFLAEVVACCPPPDGGPDLVAAVGAGNRRLSDSTWRVRNSRQVSAAARLLAAVQPPGLAVRLPSTVPAPLAGLRALLQGLAGPGGPRGGVDFSLQLYHSRVTYEPMDPLLGDLAGVRGLELGRLTLCIEGGGAVGELASLVGGCSAPPLLCLSLPRPLQHHLLQLHGLQHHLYVRVRPCGSSPAPHTRPLPPMGTPGPAPPALTVEGVEDSPPHELGALILALAPLDNRYRELQLQQCSLDGKQLQQLLEQLQAAQLHTTESQDSARTEIARTSPDGCCEICCKKHALTGSKCVLIHLPVQQQQQHLPVQQQQL